MTTAEDIRDGSYTDDDESMIRFLRAEVERLTEQLRLAQIDNNNAETECAGWREEALAARAMLLIEQHQIRGNDHPLIVVRAVQGNALQQADYADARAANEEKP